jgi:hypothetical protein
MSEPAPPEESPGASPEAPPEGSPEPLLVDPGGIATVAVLRRIERLAAGYGILAGVALAAGGGWRRGLALTAAAAVSIVALRSLEGVVGRLRAVAEEDPPALGWRYPLRLFLLAGLFLLLVLGRHDALALVLGLSAVPLAVLVEAGLQLLLARGGER